MFNPSHLQFLILLVVLGGVSPALAQQQGVMSDARDAVIESEWGQKKKRQFDELKERLDDRFVQPLVRLREQYACSAGWRGNECEKMFPETRERIGRSLESLQENAASAPRRARDLEARLAEEVGEARAGLKRLLETDEEKAERVRNVRDLALVEARKEKERIDALNARNLAEQQQMARKFAEDQARLERERAAQAKRDREREAEQAEELAQHESEVNQAVGLFLNMMGAAASARQAENARQQAYQRQQALQRQQQLSIQQQEQARSNAEFQARKQQIEQQQALQRQQQFQAEARARQQQQSGSSGGGSLGFCAKEEGGRGGTVCY